jgi:hypothetical protein
MDPERVVAAALGSVRAEGMEPSPEVLVAADDVVAGRISIARFVALVLQLVGERRSRF